MLEALIISNILAWLVIILLALLVFALARQVGVLHERVAPAGALLPTSGPKVGELTRKLMVTTLTGDKLTLGGSERDGERGGERGIERDGRATLILFVSPTCPVCKTLVPTAKSLARVESSRLQLIFASDGDSLEQHQAYARDLDLAAYPYTISQELGMVFGVSKLPFAVLIGGDGILISKGLVNSREHLESLIESMDSGVSTLQDYIKNANGAARPETLEQTS
ncbi:MAG: thioredoxin-like domain-containing protein [Pseudohongiellaceae bacterium]